MNLLTISQMFTFAVFALPFPFIQVQQTDNGELFILAKAIDRTAGIPSQHELQNTNAGHETTPSKDDGFKSIWTPKTTQGVILDYHLTTKSNTESHDLPTGPQQGLESKNPHSPSPADQPDTSLLPPTLPGHIDNPASILPVPVTLTKTPSVQPDTPDHPATANLHAQPKINAGPGQTGPFDEAPPSPPPSPPPPPPPSPPPPPPPPPPPVPPATEPHDVPVIEQHKKGDEKPITSAMGAPGLPQSVKATHYGGNLQGACGSGFSVPPSFGAMAVGNEQFAQGTACGECFLATYGKFNKMIMAVDECPECSLSQDDLFESTWKELAKANGDPMNKGILTNIKMEAVSCGFTSGVVIEWKPGSNEQWCALAVRNSNVPVVKMSVQRADTSDAPWIELVKNKAMAHFVPENNADLPGSSFNIKLTSSISTEIILTNVNRLSSQQATENF